MAAGQRIGLEQHLILILKRAVNLNYAAFEHGYTEYEAAASSSKDLSSLWAHVRARGCAPEAEHRADQPAAAGAAEGEAAGREAVWDGGGGQGDDQGARCHGDGQKNCRVSCLHGHET